MPGIPLMNVDEPTAGLWQRLLWFAVFRACGVGAVGFVGLLIRAR
jgi:hypothetical protein